MPAGGEAFLSGRLGPGHVLPDATLESVVAKVPDSRLPDVSWIDRSAEARIRHSRGQSLPDWLAVRSGELGVFTDGVALPESKDDIRRILQAGLEGGWVLIPYGGGTSVAGHITPGNQHKPVLTVSLARMDQLLELDEVSQLATFGPGTPGPRVEEQLREHGYVLGHFPQSYELSTIGGWVATRSSGQQSYRYGRIEQLFAGGTLETFEGPLEMPTFPASSAGPDLREVVLGSEGRFGIISEVKVRVSPIAPSEDFYVAFAPDWETSIELARRAAQRRIPLSMLRLSNAIETETHLALAGKPGAITWLLRYLSLRGIGEGRSMITFGITGSRAQCRSTKAQVGALCRELGAVNMGTRLGKIWAASRFRSPYLRHTLWDLGYAVDTLETAVDWPRLADAITTIETSIREAVPGRPVHVFTHMSHIYAQGASIYTSYVFPNAKTYEETLGLWRVYKRAASEAVVASGGTISHQHGVGRDHAPYLEAEKTARGMQALGALREHFDPSEVLNPGVLFAATTDSDATDG
jgi:alkyldihydroxyacetonephosphate synthase